MRELSTLKMIDTTALQEQEKNSDSTPFGHTVIFGLGNPLLGDKGVGVHAARRLQIAELPQTVKVVEVGTAILETILALKYAKRIIALDAMTDGRSPGTVYKIPLDHCNGSPCIATMHDFDIFKIMALAGRKRKDPLPMLVFGVEPDTIHRSITLSPAVAGAIPSLIDAIKEELQN